MFDLVPLACEQVSGSKGPVGTHRERSSWWSPASFDGGDVRSGAPDALTQLILIPPPFVS
ncbi:hypothetical protein GCM10017688_48800 [Streptomyces ramulosus]